jgi:hypothetical protein
MGQAFGRAVSIEDRVCVSYIANHQRSFVDVGNHGHGTAKIRPPGSGCRPFLLLFSDDSVCSQKSLRHRHTRTGALSQGLCKFGVQA